MSFYFTVQYQKVCRVFHPVVAWVWLLLNFREAYNLPSRADLNTHRLRPPVLKWSVARWPLFGVMMITVSHQVL